MGADCVDRIEKNLSALEQLLDVETVKDIKKRIGDLIVDRVRSDINQYDYYLFYPSNYEETIDQAFEKTQKKITKMYQDAMLESAQEAVRRFKDISQTALAETPGLKLRDCHKCKWRKINKCSFYEDKKYYWIAHDTICAEEGFVNYEEKRNN